VGEVPEMVQVAGLTGEKVVGNGYGVSLFEETLHEVAADEAGASGHENLHVI
jgi:hypothetical protein